MQKSDLHSHQVTSMKCKHEGKKVSGSVMKLVRGYGRAKCYASKVFWVVSGSHVFLDNMNNM